MKDICVPIPGFGDDEIAELHLKIGDRKISYDFRIESFLWEVEDELTEGKDRLTRSIARIERLRQAINSYDKSWELVQIFNPPENSRYIQVLFRKKR
jgi:hypothetical protein